jgi:hypothetical protein
MRGLAACIAVLSLTVSSWVAPPLARAQDAPPPVEVAAPEAGRFTMVPSEGGFVRLDTRTGIVSHCRRETADAAAPWRCATIPEDVLNQPDRLSALSEQIETLGRDLAALRLRVETLERDKEAAPVASPDLSSDEETQRALDFSEELMRRFFGLMREMKRGDENRT